MKQSCKLNVVGIRLIKEQTLLSNKSIGSAEDAVKLMAKELSQYNREVFCVVNFNTKMVPLNMNIVGMGSIDSSPVPIAEMFKCALLSNASRMIAFHNHPSGDPTPSREDIFLTERIIAAGALLDIPVEDHIIIAGENQYLSMRKSEYVEFYRGVSEKDLYDFKKNVLHLGELSGKNFFRKQAAQKYQGMSQENTLERR